MTAATTLLALLQTTLEAPQGITSGALAFMAISMLAVTGLTAWCFLRIVRGRAHFDPDGTGPARPPVPGELEREGRRPPP